MNRWMLTAAVLAVSGTVAAKLPPPDDATKAKAAETAAKTAWQGKVDAYKLCLSQDRVAAKYKAGHPAKASAASPPAAGASSPATAAKPAVPGTSAPTAATSSDGATPAKAVVAAAPPVPACADPGPFAYAPPEQKPLEASGAHSPAANASSPPSVRAESGTMTSGKTDASAKK